MKQKLKKKRDYCALCWLPYH